MEGLHLFKPKLVSFYHVKRENNGIADKLANEGTRNEKGVVYANKNNFSRGYKKDAWEKARIIAACPNPTYVPSSFPPLSGTPAFMHDDESSNLHGMTELRQHDLIRGKNILHATQ